MDNNLKVLAISDQHGNLPDIPPCDILLIAGDVCPTSSHNLDFQYGWLDTNFRFWLNKIPAKRVVMTFGNHDFVSQHRQGKILDLDLKADILYDDYVVVNSVKIWGSPWSLYFYDWAWNAYETDLEKIYQKIPDDVDIIITHGPPWYYGDRTVDGENVGSVSLNMRLNRLSKKVLVCGHIHESYGLYNCGTRNENRIYNVSLVNRRYEMVHPITEIPLNRE